MPFVRVRLARSPWEALGQNPTKTAVALRAELTGDPSHPKDPPPRL